MELLIILGLLMVLGLVFRNKIKSLLQMIGLMKKPVPPVVSSSQKPKS